MRYTSPDAPIEIERMNERSIALIVRKLAGLRAQIDTFARLTKHYPEKGPVHPTSRRRPAAYGKFRGAHSIRWLVRELEVRIEYFKEASLKPAHFNQDDASAMLWAFNETMEGLEKLRELEDKANRVDTAWSSILNAWWRVQEECDAIIDRSADYENERCIFEEA